MGQRVGLLDSLRLGGGRGGGTTAAATAVAHSHPLSANLDTLKLPHIELLRVACKHGCVERRGRVRCARLEATNGRVVFGPRAVNDRVELGICRRAIALPLEAARRSELEHAHHLAIGEFIHRLRLCGRAAVDHPIEVELLLRALHDALLDGPFRDEAV